MVQWWNDHDTGGRAFTAITANNNVTIGGKSATQGAGSGLTTFFEIVNDNNPNNQLIVYNTFGSTGLAGQNNIHFVRARGTAAVPTPAKNTDEFESVGYRSYVSGVLTNSQAARSMIATEDWGTNFGCLFQFEVTPTGTNTRQIIMQITGTGINFPTSGSNKITGMANGTASSDAATFGQIKVLQTVTATSNTAFSTTSSTFQSTNLAATITPTSASNRILIMMSGMIGSQNVAVSDALCTVFRGATNLGAGANNAFIIVEGSGVNSQVPGSIVYVDSPATTSATTYTIKISNDVGGQTINFGIGGTTQSLVLMEVV